MFLRFLAVSLLLLAACDREHRDSRGQPLAEGPPGLAQTTSLHAGSAHAQPPDPRAKAYEENSYHLNEGARLYRWMNCVGCHAHGGGGMGPPLMDDQWRYGGHIEQIVATILQGRPNGMPSFQGMMTEQQVWQVAAYVRSLSGQAPKDAVSSRSDEMSNIEPQTLTERRPVRSGDQASLMGTAQ